MKSLALLIQLLICLSVSGQAISPIVITDQSINIPGLMVVGVWQSQNSNQPYPDYPKIYYAFSQGDEISISFSTNNGKGTQRIIVSEYDSKSVAYTNSSFQALSDVKIKVPKTAVYQFEFATNHLIDRQCQVIIKRFPSSEATRTFNHNVIWQVVNDTTFSTREEKVIVKSKYEAVSIQTPINQYVNSATKMGGKTRITFPIILPENTVEWYYTFAATRNRADVDKTKASMQLLGDISKAIDRTGSVSFAITALSEPPGANYCDVYLFTEENYQPFLSKANFNHIPEASRANLMSGVVKVKSCCQQGQYFIGFRNPDFTYGIEVLTEVVAITKTDIYENKVVKTPVSIKQIKVPVIAN